MVQIPHSSVLRMPCDSSVLNITRPSLSTTGCRAEARFKKPISSTLLPSSSMTNSCKFSCLPKARGGRYPLRLLVNTTFPPGTGQGPRLNTPLGKFALPFSGVRKSFGPVRRPRVGREFLVRQTNDFPGLDVDLVDVGTSQVGMSMVRGLVMKIGEIDPLAVERNRWIGGRAFPAFEQDGFAAIGMQQHQISASCQRRRRFRINPNRAGLVTKPRTTDIDDVVFVLDRLVGRNVRHVSTQRPLLFGGSHRYGPEHEDYRQGDQSQDDGCTVPNWHGPANELDFSGTGAGTH